jgi:hypothetical protein
MTNASTVPPHQAALVRELTALGHALSDFRDALRPVNDEALSGAFREVLDDAERIIGRHLARPGEYIADDMANLRSQFARRHVPREDPELGRTPSLTALRNARGSILADFDSVLAEARNLGRVPTDPSFDMPTGVEFERAGREGQLAALEQRLRKVERDLETRIEPEGRSDAAHSRQQTGLVNFYVEAMRIELTLARLEAKARDLIDLASLARAIGAVGEIDCRFRRDRRGIAGEGHRQPEAGGPGHPAGRAQGGPRARDSGGVGAAAGRARARPRPPVPRRRGRPGNGRGAGGRIFDGVC